jgi:L-asparaginase II
VARRPISVTVTRGKALEAVHRVHAVAVDANGRRVEAVGDPELVTFFRSAAKPLQALPLVRVRTDLDEREIAIACASHLADDAQLAAVRSLLAKAPAEEDELECGPVGVPPARINHNCSGKHAGMLTLCRARGWESAGYRLAEHPAQREMLAEVAVATGLPHEEIATAVDGCGVTTFALSLDRMALAFARLRRYDGGERVAEAMAAHPTLIRGNGAADTRLMRALPGWIAKGGAEGLLCAASPDGLGIAAKVEDGASRATAPALATFLAGLGYDVPALAGEPVHNSRGEPVGEIRGFLPDLDAGRFPRARKTPLLRSSSS